MYMHIASVEKQQLTTTGSPLLVRCKTFQSATFVIPKERDCHDIYTSLQQLYQPGNIDDLHCFNSTSNAENIPQSAGWNFFDLQSEYQRMGVPNDHWALTTANKDYEVRTRDSQVSQRDLLTALSCSSVIRIPNICTFHPRSTLQYWWEVRGSARRDVYRCCLICTTTKQAYAGVANLYRVLVPGVSKMKNCWTVF